MFRLEHPYLLYLLAIIPIVFIAQWLLTIWCNKRLNQHFSKANIKSLAPARSTTKTWLKLIVYSIAFIFLIIGVSNPQSGSKMEEVKRKGVDVMIALDISNSMLAEDLYPNRLDRAKRSIQELFTKFKSDRVGIVVFAGESFVQLPITTDYSAAKLFLNSIETDLISTQGTDIGNAISLCLKSFDEDSPAAKSIILISDGENHQEEAMAAVESASEKGVVIHTIGMGSIDGAPIPVYSRGNRIGFRQNKEGNTVVTKLNESMLRELAETTGGTFIRASNANSGIDFVFSELEKMEKVDFGSKIYTDFEDRFQYFLAVALILLIIELIIPNTRSIWWEKLFAS
ncbi:MAG: VWA domain-containing protein [Flavobacteriales bacterium]|nr:VWA domain-containing protein [Flavobacteriales bacterium]